MVGDLVVAEGGEHPALGRGHDRHAEIAVLVVALAADHEQGVGVGPVDERRRRAARGERRAEQRGGGVDPRGGDGADGRAAGEGDRVDHPPLRHRRGADVGQDVVGGGAGDAGQRRAGAPKVQHLGRAPVALGAFADAVVALVFAAHHQVQPVVQERAAPHQRIGLGLGVAAFGAAALDLALQPHEAVVEHHVDHAGHRVRAIGGRGAAGDHVHPVDQSGGDHVGVDGAEGGGGHEALAVDQHQGPLGLQPAQVEHAAADVGAVGVQALGRRRLAGQEGRQLVDRVADVHRRALLEPLGPHHGHRCRGGEAVADDPRAGDDHLADLRARGGGPGRRGLGPGLPRQGGGTEDEKARTTEHVAGAATHEAHDFPPNLDPRRRRQPGRKDLMRGSKTEN